MYENIHYLLISLNVIFKLKVNDKIYINTNGSISSSKDSKVNAVYRWINGENRIKSCAFLTNIINQCITQINLLNLSSNEIDIQYKIELTKYLTKCKDGLQCLKITYNQDVYVNSVIDALLDKILIHCGDNMENRLVEVDNI